VFLLRLMDASNAVVLVLIRVDMNFLPDVFGCLRPKTAAKIRVASCHWMDVRGGVALRSVEGQWRRAK